MTYSVKCYVKYFVLAVIVFFCARCFSQSYDYYYVDEYIRATEDRDYADYLKQKMAEENSYQNGVDEYKEEQKYSVWLQEQQRLDHLDEKEKIKPEDTTKAEVAHETELALYEKRQLELQRTYAELKDKNIEQKWQRQNPERMIASLPTYEKIPKPNRKYKFKTPPKKK